MPVNYPKFDQKIQDQINVTNFQQPRSRPGIITSFDRMNNSATIVLDDHNSDLMGSVITDVPCPTTKGIQSVAPTIGTRCLVAFRDTNEARPYVIGFFEDTKRNMTYTMNNIVDTGVPRYMVH
jgi:hypothetical protein